MRNFLLKSLIAAGACAMICACSDENSGDSNFVTPNTPNSEMCSKMTLLRAGWLVEFNNSFLIVGDDAVVRDVADQTVGAFDATTGNILDNTGAVVMQNVDLNSLTHCDANFVPTPVSSETVPPVPASSASPENPPMSATSSAVVPASSTTEPPIPGSSAVVPPTSSAEVPASSAEVPVASSSSAALDANGFPTLESYGEPPAEYTKDILSNNQTGWNSRYWDACKPHCAWISDGQEGKTDTTTQESYVKGMTTARNCNIHDVEVPTFTLGHAVSEYWMGYEGTTNACGGGAKGVFTCTDMAPIAVNENLSYAYVAGPGSATTCGKCFHLQYDGSFKDASGNNAPKETHKALKGKHIIVMTSNIGHDVERGQFDLMVPGGGVGAFDALSTQVNGAGINWGAGFGGFLTECQSKNGYDNKLEVYQQCVKDMCDAAFGNAGLPNLLRGCHWFADWYMAADNPTYHWEEVECPQYLLDHYLTRINTTKDNKYKWHDDWSTYKEGDELETQDCWRAGEDGHSKEGCNI